MHTRNKTVICMSAVIAISFIVSGCATANRNTSFRTFTTAGGKSVSVDAKQRFLVNTTRWVRDEKGDPVGSPVEVLCAEPSPDALSAFAAALDASLSINRGNNQTNLGFGESINEAAGSIGLRTQTITILRDELYRLCEGYAAGAFDDIEFRRLHRRNQANQLGLLAIEQITGAVRAPALALASSGGGDPAKSLEAASTSVELREVARDKAEERWVAAEEESKKAMAQQIIAEGDLVKAEAALKASTDINKADLAAKRDAVQKKLEADKSFAAKQAKLADQAAVSLKDRIKSLDAAQVTLDSVRRRASVTSSTNAAIEPMIPTNGGLSDDAVRYITAAAEGIVKTLATTSYVYETCLDIMTPRQTDMRPELVRLDDLNARQVTRELCNVLLAEGLSRVATNDAPSGNTSGGVKSAGVATGSENQRVEQARRDVQRAEELFKARPPQTPNNKLLNK